MVFKARVNMSAVFAPPPLRGIPQPIITAREWHRRLLLTAGPGKYRSLRHRQAS